MEIGRRKVNVRVYAHKILRLRTFSSLTYVNVRRQKRDSENPPLLHIGFIVASVYRNIQRVTSLLTLRPIICTLFKQ